LRPQTCATVGAMPESARIRRCRENGQCIDCEQPADAGFRCRKCADQENRRQRATVKNRRDQRLCIRCGQPNPRWPKVHCQLCADNSHARSRPSHRRTYAEKKKKVLDYYGRLCTCCGESNESFLTIDHVNSDGALHRKTMKSYFYYWLVKHNFPPGFQTLCYNCNLGRARNGGVCPHLTGAGDRRGSASPCTPAAPGE